MTLTGFSGIVIILLFLGAMIAFYLTQRGSEAFQLREISSYRRLSREIRRAVESGTQLHVSLGWGGITSSESASAFAGLSILKQIIKESSICDYPPVSSTGNAVVSILAQDTIQSTSQAISIHDRKSSSTGELIALTPYSYAAGTLTSIRNPKISANVLSGWYGPEVIWLTSAAERQGTPIIAGTAQLPSQAVMYATATDPLIGEELFVGGAYLGGGKIHEASVNTQDIFRWVIIAVILLGAVLSLLGVDYPFQTLLGGAP